MPPEESVQTTQNQRFQRIWAVIQRIPAGRVRAYGEVARLAGLPGRARLVARALRLAPDDLDLPWYRVLGAGGRISLPEGSEGALEQRERLEAEGARFEGSRIHKDCWAGANDDLDALLWEQ
jgi:methylated-DNA-protein-cysteine methyltransferase related protein